MPTENELNTELLDAELPDVRFDGGEAYLRWLYDENPEGPALQANGDEDGRRMAHYALVPQRYRNAAGPAPLLFSLNAVTRSGSQRKGWWARLGRDVFAQAEAAGRRLVIGIPNERSTPGAVKYLDYRYMGPLPVKLVVPTAAGRRFESREATPAFLDSPAYADLVAGIDEHEAVGWVQSWSPEQLRWRLSRPNATYVLHSSPDLVAVSALTHASRVPVAAIVGLLPKGPLASEDTISSRGAIAVACRYHRAPLAVYAGFNRHVPVRGAPVPRRLRPAPLNLVCHSFSDEVPQETFVLDTFEFLDMDAY